LHFVVGARGGVRARGQVGTEIARDRVDRQLEAVHFLAGLVGLVGGGTAVLAVAIAAAAGLGWLGRFGALLGVLGGLFGRGGGGHEGAGVAELLFAAAATPMVGV